MIHILRNIFDRFDHSGTGFLEHSEFLKMYAVTNPGSPVSPESFHGIAPSGKLCFTSFQKLYSNVYRDEDHAAGDENLRTDVQKFGYDLNDTQSSTIADATTAEDSSAGASIASESISPEEDTEMHQKKTDALPTNSVSSKRLHGSFLRAGGGKRRKKAKKTKGAGEGEAAADTKGVKRTSSGQKKKSPVPAQNNAFSHMMGSKKKKKKKKEEEEEENNNSNSARKEKPKSNKTNAFSCLMRKATGTKSLEPASDVQPPAPVTCIDLSKEAEAKKVVAKGPKTDEELLNADAFFLSKEEKSRRQSLIASKRLKEEIQTARSSNSRFYGKQNESGAVNPFFSPAHARAAGLSQSKQNQFRSLSVGAAGSNFQGRPTSPLFNGQARFDFNDGFCNGPGSSGYRFGDMQDISAGWEDFLARAQPLCKDGWVPEPCHFPCDKHLLSSSGKTNCNMRCDTHSYPRTTWEEPILSSSYDGVLACVNADGGTHKNAATTPQNQPAKKVVFATKQSIDRFMRSSPVKEAVTEIIQNVARFVYQIDDKISATEPEKNPIMAVGDEVVVASRTWPGSNKLGGAGKIVAVHYGTKKTDESPQIPLFYDVKYVISKQTDKRIEPQYVRKSDLTDSGTVLDDHMKSCESNTKRTSDDSELEKAIGKLPMDKRTCLQILRVYADRRYSRQGATGVKGTTGDVRDLVGVGCGAGFKVGRPSQAYPWTHKYRPMAAKEVCGNADTIRNLRSWLNDWKQHDGHVESGYGFSDDEEDNMCNIMLLHGPTGVGKSAAVYAVAAELGFEVLELSSNENRSQKDIMAKFGEATQSHRLGLCSKNALERQRKKQKRDAKKKGKVISLIENKAPSGFFSRGVQKKKSMPKCKAKAKGSRASSKRGLKQDTKKFSLILLDEVDNLDLQSKLSNGEKLSLPMNESESESKSNVRSTSPVSSQTGATTCRDDGFYSALKKLVRQTKRPIILTCNEAIPSQISDRGEGRCRALGMGEKDRKMMRRGMAHPSTAELLLRLSLICFAEGIAVNTPDLASLIRNCNHDIRKCLNHLQFFGSHDLLPNTNTTSDSSARKSKQADVKTENASTTPVKKASLQPLLEIPPIFSKGVSFHSGTFTKMLMGIDSSSGLQINWNAMPFPNLSACELRESKIYFDEISRLLETIDSGGSLSCCAYGKFGGSSGECGTFLYENLSGDHVEGISPLFHNYLPFFMHAVERKQEGEDKKDERPIKHPSIFEVLPCRGPCGGGTEIEIVGENFQTLLSDGSPSSEEVSVLIAGVPCVNCRVVSDKKILACTGPCPENLMKVRRSLYPTALASQGASDALAEEKDGSRTPDSTDALPTTPMSSMSDDDFTPNSKSQPADRKVDKKPSFSTPLSKRRKIIPKFWPSCVEVILPSKTKGNKIFIGSGASSAGMIDFSGCTRCNALFTYDPSMPAAEAEGPPLPEQQTDSTAPTPYSSFEQTINVPGHHTGSIDALADMADALSLADTFSIPRSGNTVAYWAQTSSEKRHGTSNGLRMAGSVTGVHSSIPDSDEPQMGHVLQRRIASAFKAAAIVKMYGGIERLEGTILKDMPLIKYPLPLQQYQFYWGYGFDSCRASSMQDLNLVMRKAFPNDNDRIRVCGSGLPACLRVGSVGAVDRDWMAQEKSDEKTACLKGESNAGATRFSSLVLDYLPMLMRLAQVEKDNSSVSARGRRRRSKAVYRHYLRQRGMNLSKTDIEGLVRLGKYSEL